MRTQRDAAEVILGELDRRERSIAWLSRETGITYKTLLRELKHKPDSLRFFHAMVIARALDMDVESLLPKAA